MYMSLGTNNDLCVANVEHICRSKEERGKVPFQMYKKITTQRTSSSYILPLHREMYCDHARSVGTQWSLFYKMPCCKTDFKKKK